MENLPIIEDANREDVENLIETLTGKTQLDDLQMQKMLAQFGMIGRKSKHNTARNLRAKSRIAKRKSKR